MSNWSQLCEFMNPLINNHVEEKTYQDSFVSYLKVLFGWNKENIHTYVPVQTGVGIKEADIVISKEDSHLLIEMKNPDVILGESERNQLSSYMRIKSCTFGLLIGNKIEVFYDNSKPLSNVAPIITIPFEANNQTGEELGILLHINNFSSDNFEHFITQHLENAKITQEINKEITGENLIRVLKDYLSTKGYNTNLINKVFEDYLIDIKKKDSVPVAPIGPIGSGGGGGSLPLTLLPDDETFNERILKFHKVHYTIYYKDKSPKEGVWNASKITKDSYIRGNISSHFFRGWQKKGIISGVFEVRI